MQRYFVQLEQIEHDQVTISGDDAHHLARVMRMQPGDEIIVCDHAGQEHRVRLEVFRDETVIGRIMSSQSVRSEPRVRVTLAQAMLKKDKLEWVIQKGTELGVHALRPFTSERSVVRLNRSKAIRRRERWQMIAKEAAEQAHRGRIPDVSTPMAWSDLLSEIARYEVAVIPYERERDRSLSTLWKTLPAVETCLVIIGPEGGFAPHEVAEAQQAGAQAIHLGPRILRAETAALAVLSHTMFINGEMEGTKK